MQQCKVFSSGNSATQQWNSVALTVAKCTSSGIIITSSGNALEHFIPNRLQFALLRSLGDKIICNLDKTPDLSQRASQNCPKCRNLVNGHYCQGCALLRKKFKEDLFTYCIEKGILQDPSRPSNDNTNVVNALQEPFVVEQDPDENFSQSPPQINHHCCYECGDSLKDIFCHKCTCELCGRGAHYGYNYPSKVLIVPDP
nr:hypothetical protein [Tanacetum cinerariifolium]